MHNKHQTLGILTIALSVLVGSCRTVTPIREIRPSWDPDISRITLKNGTILEFDDNFGWYDKQAGIVEGTTRDHQHVAYHLIEISKVETVRAYSIFFAIATALAIFGLGIYVLAKLLTLV
jgi:hypothetical protein